MQVYRIWTLVIRYALLAKHLLGRKLIIFYFPALDIVLFGLIGKWFSQQHTAMAILPLYLISRVLWSTSISIYHEMSGNLQIEIESLNIANLFGSPLKVNEWIIANIINGVIRGTIVFFYGIFLCWLIFGVNLLNLGAILLPLIPLFIFAWLPLSILICGIYFRYGLQALFMRWLFPMLFLFLSAVFIPLEILPSWITTISQLLPATHLFSFIKKAILYNKIHYHSITIGTIYILVYTILSLIYFKYCFNKSKKNGLAQLEHT